jgi:nitrite reductase (NADH) small subunit
MARTVLLTPADGIPEGGSAEVVADGLVFAVFNVDGVFHVLDGICPHAGGPLGKGMIRGCIVTCPWHGWQFNVSNGQHQLSDGICQPGYDATVVDGMIVVTIEE